MNLLNEDNVVHVFLNKLGDIVIANLLFILCCIPVITIGPSLTALYHCMMRTVKGNNNGTTKTFFRAFKENFKQSLIIWLLILAAGTMIILNIRFLLHAEGSAAHMLFYLSVGVLTLLIIFTLYIFPVIATFANTLGALCRNAFLLAFMHFPTTIAIAVITIFPLYMTYLDAKLQPLYACCWFFFGFGLVAFINSMLLYRFFKKLLPPEEDISLLWWKAWENCYLFRYSIFRYSIFAFQSGGNLRGGKHSELRSPFFPLALPLSGHAILSYAVGMC